MNAQMEAYFTEIHQNYNDLGEDLLMLEAIVTAEAGERGFPGEYVESGMERLGEYIEQHTGELRQLVRYLIRHKTGRRPTIKSEAKRS